MSVYVCVLGSSSSFKQVWLNHKDTFFYVFLIGFFKVPDKCFGFRKELVEEFIEIVPSAKLNLRWIFSV